MTIELDYNGSKGSNLQANLLNINQVPLSAVNDLIARLGPTAAVALLNMQANSPQAVAAGIKIPYANFTNPSIQTTRSVAQALRPYPQYNDHQHDQQRRRQNRQVDVSRRGHQADAADDARVHVPGKLHVLEADDQRRHVQRQHRLDGHRAARARILDRPPGSDALDQAQHRARAAVGTRQAMAQRRRAEPHPRRMANRGGAEPTAADSRWA